MSFGAVVSGLSDRKELNASHVWYVFLVQAKLHV